LRDHFLGAVCDREVQARFLARFLDGRLRRIPYRQPNSAGFDNGFRRESAPINVGQSFLNRLQKIAW
jgi:hypothetical protein